MSKKGETNSAIPYKEWMEHDAQRLTEIGEELELLHPGITSLIRDIRHDNSERELPPLSAVSKGVATPPIEEYNFTSRFLFSDWNDLNNLNKLSKHYNFEDDEIESILKKYAINDPFLLFPQIWETADTELASEIIDSVYDSFEADDLPIWSLAFWCLQMSHKITHKVASAPIYKERFRHFMLAGVPVLLAQGDLDCREKDQLKQCIPKFFDLHPQLPALDNPNSQTWQEITRIYHKNGKPTDLPPGAVRDAHQRAMDLAGAGDAAVGMLAGRTAHEAAETVNLNKPAGRARLQSAANESITNKGDSLCFRANPEANGALRRVFILETNSDPTTSKPIHFARVVTFPSSSSFKLEAGSMGMNSHYYDLSPDSEMPNIQGLKVGLSKRVELELRGETNPLTLTDIPASKAYILIFNPADRQGNHLVFYNKSQQEFEIPEDLADANLVRVICLEEAAQEDIDRLELGPEIFNLRPQATPSGHGYFGGGSLLSGYERPQRFMSNLQTEIRGLSSLQIKSGKTNEILIPESEEPQRVLCFQYHADGEKARLDTAPVTKNQKLTFERSSRQWNAEAFCVPDHSDFQNLKSGLMRVITPRDQYVHFGPEFTLGQLIDEQDPETGEAEIEGADQVILEVEHPETGELHYLVYKGNQKLKIPDTFANQPSTLKRILVVQKEGESHLKVEAAEEAPKGVDAVFKFGNGIEQRNISANFDNSTFEIKSDRDTDCLIVFHSQSGEKYPRLYLLCNLVGGVSHKIQAPIESGTALVCAVRASGVNTQQSLSLAGTANNLEEVTTRDEKGSSRTLEIDLEKLPDLDFIEVIFGRSRASLIKGVDIHTETAGRAIFPKGSVIQIPAEFSDCEILGIGGFKSTDEPVFQIEDTNTNKSQAAVLTAKEENGTLYIDKPEAWPDGMHLHIVVYKRTGSRRLVEPVIYSFAPGTAEIMVNNNRKGSAFAAKAFFSSEPSYSGKKALEPHEDVMSLVQLTRVSDPSSNADDKGSGSEGEGNSGDSDTEDPAVEVQETNWENLEVTVGLEENPTPIIDADQITFHIDLSEASEADCGPIPSDHTIVFDISGDGAQLVRFLGQADYQLQDTGALSEFETACLAEIRRRKEVQITAKTRETQQKRRATLNELMQKLPPKVMAHWENMQLMTNEELWVDTGGEKGYWLWQRLPRDGVKNIKAELKKYGFYIDFEQAEVASRIHRVQTIKIKKGGSERIYNVSDPSTSDPRKMLHSGEVHEDEVALFQRVLNLTIAFLVGESDPAQKLVKLKKFTGRKKEASKERKELVGALKKGRARQAGEASFASPLAFDINKEEAEASPDIPLISRKPSFSLGSAFDSNDPEAYEKFHALLNLEDDYMLDDFMLRVISTYQDIHKLAATSPDYGIIRSKEARDIIENYFEQILGDFNGQELTFDQLKNLGINTDVINAEKLLKRFQDANIPLGLNPAKTTYIDDIDFGEDETDA